MPTISIGAMRRLLALNGKGLERTGSLIFHSVRRPWCHNPVPRHVQARTGKAGSSREDGRPVHLDIWVPCRKCELCLAYRQLDWRQRAMSEIRSYAKNWFVTLTFKPEAREQLFTEVVPEAERQGADTPMYRMLSQKRCAQKALSEVGDYLKRLRHHMKTSPDLRGKSSLRFFAVTEPHKDGYPHIHMLLHADALTARTIRKGGWKHGFISMKIVDAEAAGYITKYLSKEINSVRASINYGRPDLSKLPKSKRANVVS